MKFVYNNIIQHHLSTAEHTYGYLRYWFKKKPLDLIGSLLVTEILQINVHEIEFK